MSVFGALALMAAVGVPTYLMRGGVILALGERAVPPVVERALRNVGPAVMAALVVNLVAGGDDGIGGVTGAELAAIGVGLAVAAWRRNVILTLVAGMATLWLVSAIT